VFNLMLLAAPMCVLFFLGIFLSYLLVLKRENRRFPWMAFLKWLAVAAVLLAAVAALAVIGDHNHLTWRWPFVVR
jgi:sec-independent protein translocase protein TatC